MLHQLQKERKKKKKGPAVIKTFRYEAKNTQGQRLVGEISAVNTTMARAMLRKQGIINPAFKEKKASLFKKKAAGTRVSPLDIAIFLRQMSTMQKAGIPLVQGLGVIIEGTERQGLANLIKKVKEDVETGASFSQSLTKYPKEFDELVCSLIAAGEESGTLDTMLNRIAIYKEKTETLKRKLKKAMYYPVTVLSIAGVVTVILLLKVVPTFKEMFDGFGGELPAFTLFVLGISETLQEHGVKVFVGLAGALWAFWHAYKTRKPVQYAVERYVLKAPVFGMILKKTVIARFARTLATTFAAGVPLTEALLSVAKSSGNIVYFDAIIKIRDNVSAGQQMQFAMQQSGIFPNMVVQMVAIGEESGTLETMLGKVADIFEEEVDSAVDGMSTLLEPMIMVILGVVVGGLVVAMYLPIFKMGSVV